MANYAISKHRTCGCIDLRVKFKNVKFETADVYNSRSKRRDRRRIQAREDREEKASAVKTEAFFN